MNDDNNNETIMTDLKELLTQELVDAAKDAYNKAYAPYSNFHVGAAALTANGNIVKGCNVENASYGLTVCAERNCISNAVINGEQEFQLIVIYTEQDELTPPCGACRQVISEFFANDAPVVAVNHKNVQKIWTVSGLLPDAFTPKQLSNV
ncbi:cytidine deaminase [Psychrosphaera saromensis]|jgi:cytidine deaminase|uniref:Cytidine deaminase n=1 Tax=Psychrosphaera saromensis TaxID=716813 RepID=A0A2S7US18_9GAMM|nr:cytidine deaminase [Psychrosphaera saromensis]PQJ52539.1 cytidine deaminase [Psychrosphaera saromensis]GHB69281.1 cytidine deaminase [Psychrosphaera saromensis]GLQ13003.1 cytidine deaminase [Psychrosphaera saromensis]